MKQYFRETEKRVALGITRNLDFPPHIHEDVELVYMIKGRCTACCGEKKYELRAGSFFLAFPEQVHHYYGSTNCEAYLIIVNPAYLSRYAAVLRQKAPVSSEYNSGDSDLVTLLRLAVQEHLSGGDRGITLDLLTAALGKLLEHYSLHTYPAQDGTVAQIVKYCSAHYREPISVQTMAKELYLSQSHISHTFHDKMKISFPDYINSLRLDDALRLLEDGSHSMEQIAELAGFPTVRTFNRVFRARFNMSPSQHKKTCL